MIINVTFQSKNSLYWAVSNLVLFCSVLITLETGKRQTIGCEFNYNMKLGGQEEGEEG